MILETRTIELIQGSSAKTILKEFVKWYDGEAVERTFQRAFNDINTEVPHGLKVIIVAMKIFMDEYGEKEQDTVKIDVEY